MLLRVVVAVMMCLVVAVIAGEDASREASDACIRRPRLADLSHPMVMLHSFPGAGNTWMRTLIEQLTGGCTGSVYDDNDLRTAGLACEGFRDGSVSAIKSHSNMMMPKHAVGGAIILFREPGAAIVAEYSRRHSTAHDGLPDASVFSSPHFGSFLNLMSLRYADGYNRQCLDFSHTKGNGTQQRVHCSQFALLWVDYADLKASPHTELARIGEFLTEVRPLHRDAQGPFAINVTCALHTPARRGIKRKKPEGYPTANEIIAKYTNTRAFERARETYEQLRALARKQQQAGHWNVYNSTVKHSGAQVPRADMNTGSSSPSHLLSPSLTFQRTQLPPEREAVQLSTIADVRTIISTLTPSAQPWIDAWSNDAHAAVIIVMDTHLSAAHAREHGHHRHTSTEHTAGLNAKQEAAALQGMFHAVHELHRVAVPVHIVFDSAHLAYQAETVPGTITKTMKVLENLDVVRLHPCHVSPEEGGDGGVMACAGALHTRLHAAGVLSCAALRASVQDTAAGAQLAPWSCQSVASKYTSSAGTACSYMAGTSSVGRIVTP
ncbi:hypothetical protein PTSG_02339 [Salpingoeca rosetta]|uniref:Sulfotransferase domain-containing protein n=1 Tax=Salpingoeca rosetta (strain ATCC 50818 / BSB-021) TaxID=946362 RepID=F2U1X0_SALR5|nr:uncharacterized protein PTSG_02339 [Salpingoeca rosetta]EGD81622.1 hypothetical protein PTSG_02339 [Salpingoeca rosetta]|eukprot:XP_004996826.1 hypothetical protein PTSG_02339 [Salpingoeca rosetta]